jgi:hypothetical protein
VHFNVNLRKAVRLSFTGRRAGGREERFLIGDLGSRAGRYWGIGRLGKMGWCVTRRGAMEGGAQKPGG